VQVEGYDLFSCYAPRVLHAAFASWRWASGFPGYLNIDDFVHFVEYAEDRSSSDAQRFWFNVLDAGGQLAAGAACWLAGYVFAWPICLSVVTDWALLVLFHASRAHHTQ
jgi:hypothetical protein